MNCYNGERFLREAIDSVLAQTFLQWELILWDDRSTDGSAEIAKGYRDPRIRYFLSPVRTTLADARNAAVSQARGKWVAFLDQDDLWRPEKLERQMACIGHTPPGRVALVYGRTLLFTPNGFHRDYDHAFEGKRLPEGAVFAQLIAHGCFISISSAMVLREAYWKVGGIPSSYRFAEDYYLFLALAAIYEFRAVQEPVCRYRMHGANMTCSLKEVSFSESLQVLEHWKGDIAPHLYARRCRTYHTLLAVHRFLSGEGRLASIGYFLRYGSLGYLLSRPIAIGFRRLKRLLHLSVLTGNPYFFPKQE